MSGSLTTLGIPSQISPEVEARREKAQADSELLRDVFAPNKLKWKNIDWVVTGFLLFIHIGALAAFVPAFFSWQGLVLCAVMHWFTCSAGICLGYHRYLSHKALKLRSPAKFLCMLAGSLSGEGSPMT